MHYDFTTLPDRRGRDALALDAVGERFPAPQTGFEPIPMWVADMNFLALPAIPQAIIARASHPSYGYFAPRQEYTDAILRWQRERNGVEGLTADCIGYENGVLGGVVSAANAMCARGSRILVHSPTYIGFTHCLENNGYRLVHSPLVRDAAGVWRMDYADMEEKLRTQHIHCAVLCSPHNPCGRVWQREELERAMALFQTYGVQVISDEIWSDLTLPGAKHIPTQSVSEDARSRTVALYAPSKTFNLAGLVGSYHIIYDPALRDRVRREGSLSHYNSMNVLSMHALIGAYGPEGAVWLDELRQVLAENVRLAAEFFRTRVSGVSLAVPEATYMLFLDCTEHCAARGRSLDELLRAGWAVGVYWQDGRPFHGPCHIRMNLALPTARVAEALHRLEQFVF